MTTYCQMCPDWEIKAPESCPDTITQKGTVLYFCTAECKDKYLRERKTPTTG